MSTARELFPRDARNGTESAGESFSVSFSAFRGRSFPGLLFRTSPATLSPVRLHPAR